jgi:ATP-dependent DNA helicase UvrD/PcrA
MSNVPDRYQQAVIDACRDSDGDIVVRARAGSGKTSTIANSIAALPRGMSVLYCVFNKKNQIEAQKSFEKRGIRADVMTLHGLGARTCRAPLDSNKLRRITEERLGAYSRDYTSSVRRGVSLAKSLLLDDAVGVRRMVKEYAIEVECPWCVLRKDEEHDCIEDRYPFDVLDVLADCKDRPGSVDFDDMIWLPHVLGMRPRGYDMVFVDEVQDENPAQISLFQKARRDGGRIVAVGDDRQSIYGFRGADRRAMARVIDALAAEVMPLSVSYRCARAVVDEARKIVSDIGAAPGAAKGAVRDDVTAGELARGAKPGDFVVSRKNAPLLRTCLSLIKNGVPAVVLGRDVGADLDGLVERSRAHRVDKLLEWVEAWKEKQIQRARASDAEADTSRFEDTAEAIKVLSEGAETIDDVRESIRRLFTDADADHKRVTCMSTHKAKGLEAPRVWLLRDTYSTKDTEEQNLLYVGITRAEMELYLVRGVQ